jgi:hypothetical protein
MPQVEIAYRDAFEGAFPDKLAFNAVQFTCLLYAQSVS